ncbi:MAG: hypothetical protein RR138_07390 [Akkermansia sp.]
MNSFNKPIDWLPTVYGDLPVYGTIVWPGFWLFYTKTPDTIVRGWNKSGLLIQLDNLGLF